MTVRLASYCLAAALLSYGVLISGDVHTTNAPDAPCFFAMLGFLLSALGLFVRAILTTK